MNFFVHQQRARRMSLRLILLFVAAVLGIVVAVDLAALVAFNGFGRGPGRLAAVVITASLATLAVIALATAYRMAGLRAGGGFVARQLGGDRVPHDTTDPQLRRLRNVVEEIAIASGVPVPEVYVLPHEAGINAFAAGWSTSDAAIAVTRGALDRLNRDELQGVIAHEFSHIVNGDMRLNTRLMGLLFGILFLALAGETLLRTGALGRPRNGKSGGNPLPLIGLALFVAGYLGVVFGGLIKASVSRQREYLADASAVQFTRQTQGLAGALKKIAALTEGAKLASPKTAEVGHMLFGAGTRQRMSWYATHPPLIDRIRALEPSFDPAELTRLAQRWSQSPPVGPQEDVALGLTGRATPAPTSPPATAAMTALEPAAVTAQVATASQAAYQYAEALLDQLPPDLLARARSVDGAVPLVLGLLLAHEPAVRAHQQAALADACGAQLAQAAAAEAAALANLDPAVRLPLAELAFPAVRYRSQTEQYALLRAVSDVITADGRLSVFEYCLSRMLHDALDEAMHPKPRWPGGGRTLASARPAVSTLLAVLAEAGHPSPGEAERAFVAGFAEAYPGEQARYVPPTRGVLDLEPVWPTLDGLSPAGKEALIRAAVTVIGYDRQMTVTEVELLRTICALLHCPLPPLTPPPALTAGADRNEAAHRTGG